MAEHGYIRKQVSAILDMKPHTIQLYTDRGLVKPDVHAPKGRGTRRKYSRRNILELAMVRELGSMGVLLSTVKYILANFRNVKTYGDILEEVEKGRVFLFIYDHDSEERCLEIEYRPRPENARTTKVEDQFGRVKEVDVWAMPDMKLPGAYRKAVVLDLSQLWQEISPRM
jgi:DNA-binding transcriptional MerR regulator